MVLFPSGGLGRLIFVVIIITTLSYFVLNLVSFGGNRWITYVDVPIRFGLWKVCDTRRSGLCNKWSDDVFISNITNSVFNGNKPDFIRSSQALEIISLIFYIFAAGLIVVGIMDLEIFPIEMAFMIAATLLFLCIIFLSASLGLMSDKGRKNHQLAFLDWAWWNGLVGLLMTIFCFFSLISFLAYIRFSSSFSPMETSQKIQRGSIGKGMFGRSVSPSMGMVQSPPPIITPNFLPNQLYNYPNSNQYSQQNYSNQIFQSPLMNYGGQFPGGQYLNNQGPLTSSGNQFPYGQYFNEQSPSPIISELARQYIVQSRDAQYERQILEPYRQYLQDPYLINNYL